MKSMDIWKLSLAWGCLGIFFVFPFAMVTIHLFHMPQSQSVATDFRYIGEYLRTVAAIIIALAGFNTAELFKKT
jgi:hypothetical protein